MNVVERYKSAREIYKKVGVDTDLAIRKLLNFPISMHCWQGDDVVGFCLLYTSPSPRDLSTSRMPSSA